MSDREIEHDFDGALCNDCPAVDLTEAISIDEYDGVVRAIEGVVHNSTSLCLDNMKERRLLINRLLVALGGVSDNEADSPTESACPPIPGPWAKDWRRERPS